MGHPHKKADTGQSILEIKIAEPDTNDERLREIETSQSTMKSWINLENENLSLKEQDIPTVFWPTSHTKNIPLPENLERYSNIQYASDDTLKNICKANGKALTSLSFYLEKLSEDTGSNVATLMKSAQEQSKSLKKLCEELQEKLTSNTHN